MIICSNPKAQYTAYKFEIDEAIHRVLDSGWYVLGKEVSSFEEEFAKFIGVTGSVSVGSGTEALHIALKALGVGQGDEVITVSQTAVATVAAIELAGAIPVFVDIDPKYYTLDVGELKRAITPKTKAVIPVHLYGQAVDLEAIIHVAKEQNLFVIEDCAQAHGAEYKGKRLGSIGDIGCFSFYPTKNLGAIGDGGIITTNNPKFAEKVRLLREYGWKERYVSHLSGFNSRLDELQAAILRVKLRHLKESTLKRIKLAELYNSCLCNTKLILPAVRNDSSHVYHQYVVRSSHRDKLKFFLKEKGVHTLIHYPMAVHQQPAYSEKLPETCILPETEKAVEEILSLPIYPELSEPEIKQVADAIKEFEG